MGDRTDAGVAHVVAAVMKRALCASRGLWSSLGRRYWLLGFGRALVGGRAVRIGHGWVGLA